MVCPAMAEFGMMIRTLSGVASVVVNTPISFTVPAVPPASTKSPTLKGRKVRSMTPLEKFDRVPWKARATARPAAPIMATKPFMGIPSADADP